MNYWNEVAGDFDSLYDQSRPIAYFINRMLRRGLFVRTELACKAISCLKNPQVLDVGCGSGRNIIAFLAAGAGHVTGVDSSDGMLTMARQRTANDAQKVTLLAGDFQDVPLQPKFDIAVALGVFDYLFDAALPVLTKMAALADGAVVFSAPGRSLVRMPLRARRYSRRGVRVHFYRREEIAELCRAAGLVNFAIQPVPSSGFVVTAPRRNRCSA